MTPSGCRWPSSTPPLRRRPDEATGRPPDAGPIDPGPGLTRPQPPLDLETSTPISTRPRSGPTSTSPSIRLDLDPTRPRPDLESTSVRPDETSTRPRT